MLILGVSEEHDAGACLVEDGRVLAAVNEERLNRHKFYIGFPEQALDAVFRLAGRRPSDVDAVALSSYLHVGASWGANVDQMESSGRRLLRDLSKFKAARRLLGTETACELGKAALYSLDNPARVKRIKKGLEEAGITLDPILFDHHYSHACSAYYTSGWDDCLVVTLDAAGDGYCSKVYRGQGGMLRQVHKVPFFHSPGYYYAAVTSLLGFKEGREGKVTGLAANGDPDKTLAVFQSRIGYDGRRRSFVNHGGSMPDEVKHFRQVLDGVDRIHIAAGIQRHLENLVVRYVRDLVRHLKLGRVRLAVAGGVFANVRLNQKLAESDEIEAIYIHPHMGDGGLAVGSAYALAAQLQPGLKPFSLGPVYFGNRYGEREMEAALKAAGLPFHHHADVESEMARLLAEGSVVARFDGGMEYGPRALGNRSILYQPTDPSVNDWLNKRLVRSEFMPFAPIIMEEEVSRYFSGVRGREIALKYMTITCDATALGREQAPAVVHVDGTARPQTVNAVENPSPYRTLQAYRRRTGLPVLINTSFNMHEEPIVDSPQSAISAFTRGHLDVLALGPFTVLYEDLSPDAAPRVAAGAQRGGS